MTQSNRLPISVDKVLVNKTGGVTASGIMSCSDAVDAFDWSTSMWSEFNKDSNGVPINLSILMNVSWTAYQSAGRKMMLGAIFGSSNFNSMDVPAYVYASNGKFGPGKVHIDVKSADPDGWVLVDGAAPVTLNLFQFIGFDLRATLAR